MCNAPAGMETGPHTFFGNSSFQLTGFTNTRSRPTSLRRVVVKSAKARERTVDTALRSRTVDNSQNISKAVKKVLQSRSSVTVHSL